MKTINEVIEILEEKTGFTWKDCSYGNDLCESIYNEETEIHIYIPNSEVEDWDEELFSSYSVWLDNTAFNEETQNKYADKHYYNIDEVIEIILTLKKLHNENI